MNMSNLLCNRMVLMSLDVNKDHEMPIKNYEQLELIIK